MRRIFGVLLWALLGLPSIASGQEWARKMFDTMDFDFGAVARGSKVEHRFVITNLYEEDVHIADVRSSCGCTIPEVSKRTLKTFEKTELLATFNTRSFLGKRSATLTVLIDQPFVAEVQLHVKGYIRSDIVLSPDHVDFKSLSAGNGAEQTVNIAYAGRDDWKILEVKSPRDYLTAELTERNRGFDGSGHSQIEYQLIVRLAPNAPAGYFNEQFTLLTNDTRAPEFPLIVEGNIDSEIEVSPSPLVMGVVAPGQTVTKKLVVRGKKPFRLTAANCPENSLQWELPTEAKTVHIVPVRFTAGDKPGKLQVEIKLETDAPIDIPPVPVIAEVTGGVPREAKRPRPQTTD